MTTALVITKSNAQYLIFQEVASFLKEQFDLAGQEADCDMIRTAERYQKELDRAYRESLSFASRYDIVGTERFIKRIRLNLEIEGLYINTETDCSLFVERFDKLAVAIREASDELVLAQ